MPRRRMLDPSFTEDIEVAQLTRDERLFLIGCLRNADDDGRLRGNPAFLKAEIFMYDDDIDLKRMLVIRDSTLKKMESWRPANIWRLSLYQNSSQDYIYFPNWGDMEKPSHPTESKLPAPPTEPQRKPPAEHTPPSGEPLEEHTKASRETPPQSSQVKYSVVKSSGVQEDFTEYIDSGRDLTDFLIETLEKYAPRGPTWLTAVLTKVWEQGVGTKMPQPLFAFTFDAVKEYPIPVLGRAFSKAVKYKGGKHQSHKYLVKILKEESEKASGGRSPPE